MASIAGVSVTVLPSEPVDTTSFYKNVLRLALAAVGVPASRMVPAYPPFGAFGFTAYGIRSPRCSCRRVCISCRCRNVWGTALSR
jgi:hypothetical protein